MPDTDPLAAKLTEISVRNEGRIAHAQYTEATVENHAAEGDVRRMVKTVDAVLKLHACVPWYAAADGCAHPEPPEDSDEHDDWYDDHRMGTTGIEICMQEQVDSYCPECTRLEYGTLEPEGDGDFVSAPCVTRSAILTGLTGEGKAGT